MSKILCIDGHNFMHRARSGFQLGDYNVIYNFVRNLKALVEQMQPTRIYFTLEGAPKRQLALLPEYKANRALDQTTEDGKDKHKSLEDFNRQKALIIELLQHLPISVVQHPDFEADDVIFNLINNSSTAVPWTVVSTDTDFIQLLQQFPHVKLYNPVTKAYVEAPKDYMYVHWKAWRGDPSDNIPGLVSDKRAVEMLTVPGSAVKELADPAIVEAWRRNNELIRFATWTDEEAMLMTSSSPAKDWDKVRSMFEGWAFQSLVKDTYWSKLLAAFDPLWGPS